MKILFIYYNRYRVLAAPPIGLSMIANSVAAEHEVEFIDLMWEDDPLQKTLAVVRDFQPRLIAVSIRNLDTQNSKKRGGFVEEIRPFMMRLKQATDAPVVLGGTAFTTFPREMLEYLGADYGLAGQGEQTFPQLVAGIEQGEVDHDLPGLVYRRNGTSVANAPRFDGYAQAYTPQRLFYDPRRYARSFWPSVVVSKTGCYFNCVYCDVRTTMGSQQRLRDPDLVIQELEYHIAQLNTRTVFLVDTCFNHPLDRAKALLEAIIAAKLRLFLGTVIRPDNVDEELVRLLKRAGVFFVGLGADTLSASMLQSYQKGFTAADVERSCRLLQRHRIAYMLELVLGGPGETVQTVEETLGFLRGVWPALVLLNAGFRILPNTPLFELAQEEGIVADRRDLLLPRYYFSKHTPPEWLYRRIRRYYMRYGYRQAQLPLLFFVRRPLHLLLGRGR